MATVNEKMTAVANEIRTLSGETGKMGLDAMATNVNTANIEVENQAAIIEQILALLETKAAYNTIHIGTTTPTDDIGVNGDIYIVRSES